MFTCKINALVVMTGTVKKRKIKIMMAEDHTSARQAYVAVLNSEPNMQVIGEAANGMELVKLIEANEPDIVITDLEMPLMNGSALLDVLKRRFPAVKPVILSMHNEDHYISQLIVNGACAYLSKSCDIDDLILTINRVFTDGYYFNKSVSKLIVSLSMKERPADTDPFFKHTALSAREIDVLRLVCDEKTNKQIADLLNITLATVDFHRQSIYKKTQVNSPIGLLKYAIRNGITSLG